jgi:hypothetical protein
VFWITRPPYVRWTFISLLVIVILWLEIRPTASTPHPFLAQDVATGELVDNAIVWTDVPEGVLPASEGSGFATHALTAGDPLLPSDTSPESFGAPPDWWIVEVALPRGAEAGSPVQLVIVPEPGGAAASPIAGVVVSVTKNDAFVEHTIGSVAVPPGSAATAAVAIANGQVSVIIQHPG